MTPREYIIFWQETYDKSQSRPTTYAAHHYVFKNHMSHVLGIGLAHAYEVAHRRDFPTITLGSRIIVPRDKFMEWIDEQAAKKSEIF